MEKIRLMRFSVYFCMHFNFLYNAAFLHYDVKFSKKNCGA